LYTFAAGFNTCKVHSKKMKTIMKRIIYFILPVVFLTGCDSILHEEEISVGKIENYDQLVEAAGGVYGELLSAMYDRSFYEANAKGDDITIGYEAYHQYYSWKKYLLIDYGPLDGTAVWKSMYKTIVSINNILAQCSDMIGVETSAKEIIGEMYLIRAYCYFKLTRNYGKIPLIKNIDVSYSVIQASYEEIYQFIEEDLKTAMELLPANNNLARVPYVTPHRGTAKALLSEVYLNWAGYPANDAAKYQLAANEAGEVIDSAAYFGFDLIDDFASLWDKAHLYNSESVFSLYLPDPYSQTYITDFYSQPYNSCFYSGDYAKNSGGICLSPTVKYFGPDFFPPEINFYNSYPKSYRKDITFYTTIYVPFSLWTVQPVDTGYYYVDKIEDIYTRAAYQKFYYDPYWASYYYHSIINGLPDSTESFLFLGIPRVYLFRYAQTVLTYAEAMARSGQLNDKAYECVNEIRRRANHLSLYSPSVYDLPAGLSAEAFADSVVQERAWEFCGEPEGRWYDLVRLERVEELATLRNAAEGGPPYGMYDKSVYFSEIPAADTILNPNLSKQ
jgi:starch-binding outer membrane protein, SusD/RagB family